ncbi:MAG TPA: response regulator [Chthoniobacterales bacterium]|nr:response regulator [Chthoniobacterales bacterium]
MHTVLVVDDVPANADIVLNHLTAAGFRVLYAGSGARALKQLEHSIPDLILLDIKMPGLDGIETCRLIKQRSEWRNIPIIFITGADELSQKLAAFAAGGVDFVSKPILPEEVEARVRTHLRIRELQSELEQKNQALSEEIELRLDAEKQLEAKLDEAFVITGLDGEIYFSTRQANILIQAFFPSASMVRLPDPVIHWLDSGERHKPLVIESTTKGDLQIDLAASDPGHLALLRLEQRNSSWGPKALQTLGLTPREAEVLYWITEGKTNPEISTILDTTLHTVKKHNNKLFAKLGVETRMAAARLALSVLTGHQEEPGALNRMAKPVAP